jgi:thiol peroxidase
MEERTGEAFELGEQLTVVGSKLKPGDQAPDFSLEHFDPAESALRTIALSDSEDKVRLLNVVNSLDTPVCHVGTRRWEELRADLPPDVQVYTVSMDLPFAQARWQSAENVSHPALSSHKSEKFGQDYGVLLKEWRLLQRAVFVIDGAGRIRHAEYVPDQLNEPDYNSAVAAAKEAAGS